VVAVFIFLLSFDGAVEVFGMIFDSVKEDLLVMKIWEQHHTVWFVLGGICDNVAKALAFQ